METDGPCEFDQFDLTGEWVKNEASKQQEGSITGP